MSHDNKGVFPLKLESLTNYGGLVSQIASPMHVKVGSIIINYNSNVNKA